ncbi:hypothetical protein JCM10213_005977 [Rhodosporidiobolus nylandii]
MLLPPALTAPLLLLLLAASFATTPLATAHSTRPPPLHPRALSHPDELTWHVLPRSAPPAEVDPLSRQLRRRDIRQEEGGDGAGVKTGGEVRWDDKLLLSFLLPPHPDSEVAGEQGEAVLLSLRPSSSLIHPSGLRSTVRTLDPSTGEWTTHEEVLDRSGMRAYEGWVVGEGEDVERWIREEVAGVVRPVGEEARGAEGWARIVLSPPSPAEESEEQGQLRFQGAFTRRGEQYTVHSTRRYLATREALDPEPPLLPPPRRGRRSFGSGAALAPRHPEMVVVRESAVLSPSERVAALRKRGLPLPDEDEERSSCSHDQLPFNTDPAHPVLQHAWEAGLPSLPANASSSFSLLSSLYARAPPAFSPFDHSSLSSSPAHAYPPLGARRLSKRQGDDISGGSGSSSNFINSIGSTAGCPKEARVVFVGVAADCTYVSAYGSTEAARTQILTDFNSVSALYQQSFNVSIGIVELSVSNASCPSTSSEIDPQNPWNLPCPSSGSSGSAGGGAAQNSSIGIDLNARLSVFSQWRGDKGGADGAGLWHLLTACQTGSEVGVAWLGQLCRVDASTSSGQTTSGTGVTAITRSEWQVASHEIGHNFGAIHDCAAGCSLQGNCCPLSSTTCNANADFIMSPVSQKNVSSFSPCSIGNICTTLSNSLNTTCLARPGASGNPNVISLQSCGNGILESGEECDPGSDGENDPCCDAATCRFVAGAVCDPKNSLCCTAQCQLAGGGTVCRAKRDETCDQEEVCDGSSAQCPDDEYESDGKSCGSGLSCASGVCTSRDLQCQNSGASLGLRSACPQSANTGCSITCRDPSSNADCIILDQSFRDGTSCGYGGRCQGGSCKSGSALDTAKSWYTNNLRIAIPVTVVVGIIVLLILWGIIRCLCCRGRRQKAYVPPKGSSYSTQYAAPPNYGNGYYPPPQNGYGGGSGGYAPPPGPPPSHPDVQRPGQARVLRR